MGRGAEAGPGVATRNDRGDFDGREYAKLSELKNGDLVEVDSGFTCLCAGERRYVKLDPMGLLHLSEGDFHKFYYYIECGAGHHGLDAQLMDDGDHLIGIYKIDP